MNKPNKFVQGELNAKALRIGIVTARFNSEVTEKLETGALHALEKMGCPSTQITVVRVPGAFEIPLAAQGLIDAGCDAVVALGAVIRGETTHYDYVCAAAERGCSEVQLRTKRPVAFGVLTTENEDQAMARAGGPHGNKGAEAAMVAVEMCDLLSQLKSRQTGAGNE